ncbi:MAG TPA: hypothetical protein VFT72_12800 [Opitutaceae bacterium]|nr:hypothetical protein [Opitutaceae bacterium]
MAIEFNAGFDSLLADLKNAGLEPVVISSMGGNRPRAAEVQVEDELSVHWDRDSRSVWVEGPWDRAEKIERMLRRKRAQRRFGRNLARPAVARRVILSALVIGALAFGSVKLIERGSTLAGNSAPAAADETSKPASESETP